MIQMKKRRFKRLMESALKQIEEKAYDSMLVEQGISKNKYDTMVLLLREDEY